MSLAIICGCGHSGTTLLANMMAAHPKCYVPLQETRVFFRRTAIPRLWWFRMVSVFKGKSFIVEKTPRHIKVIDRVKRIAPRTKIIFMVRDGRDVSASLFKRFENEAASVDRWIEANEVVFAWESDPNAIMVRYEDLITQPETELQRLCAFLGVDYAPEMLQYHTKKRLWFGTKKFEKGSDKDGEEHDKLRTWQVNQPIFDGRGKWRSVFDQAPRKLTTGRGSELMTHFGYAIADN
ncbi:MAG: sulfotransferase [Erythrobacter sp.]|uniref:sulfotransferase family protein n=1 Tax=Erythrobacter sp. TaxID=1042 RepID=UPI0032EBAF04